MKVKHRKECEKDYVGGVRASVKGDVRVHNLGKGEY